MAKIVTLGEIMLRLSPPGNKRLVQTDTFDVVFGGGEANVAVSLANYGHDACFVTRLPANEMGDAAIQQLQKYNVSPRYISRGGDRIGIYYLETGASMRPSKVIYDRQGSSIAMADITDFDFDLVFQGADWFHFSGITPAISDKAAALTLYALKAAKRHNVTISVDLNYRKKLWTPEKAQKVMKDLMPYVDVCIGNEEDAELTLGFKPDSADVGSGKLPVEAYERIFSKMQEAFGFKVIATTLRESFSASKNGWSGLLFAAGKFHRSRNYLIEPIVDRVGGGDAFSGGLIHGLLTMNHAESIEFAVAASALKQTIPGDFNLVSITEVMNLVQGDQSGRVQR